jgi:hypothetical protein
MAQRGCGWWDRLLGLPPPARDGDIVRRMRLLARLLSLPLAASLPACAEPSAAPPPPPVRLTWQKTLPATDSLRWAQAARGLRAVRGIIHLHSVFSHDACDGKPQPDGTPNAPCLANLRRGLCATRQDFALLTDHSTRMADSAFSDLFLTDPAAGDTVERAAGDPDPAVDVVGGHLRCADAVAPGHRVHIAVGGENELMPVALRRHLGPDPATRHAAMQAASPQAVRAFHEAGGVVLVAHGESHPLDQLTTLAAAGLDGMEVYNLHANIDPKIRGPYLGLDPLGAIAGLAPWLGGRPVEDGGPEPDLAFLGFLSPNHSQLDKLDTLLSAGHHLTPTLGSDIHENTLKEPLADGERGDGYRRLMRWFGNYLLIPSGAQLTTELLRQALLAGRAFGVFDLFGPPEGFDFYAVSSAAPAGGQAVELGGQAPLGSRLRIALPRPFPTALRGAEPLLRVSLRHVPLRPGGPPTSLLRSEEVLSRTLSADAFAAESGPDATPVLEFDTAGRSPGAYRVEVHLVPHHLLHLLGDSPAPFRREYPYLYSAPLWVR